MNILILHSWLKDFLGTKASPQKIAECLSLCSASVERINKIGNDWVYEIEITTNRVDMMSVMGMAREAAVVLPQFGIKAKFKNPFAKIPNSNPPAGGQIPNKISNSKFKKLNILIKDKAFCPRFTAVILENIQIKPSPKMIQERLEKSGIRAINNVIDISNYLMRAFGQPVHIFDYDMIGGQKMILRRSRAGEEITTLDGKTFKLPGDDIVIEDGEGRLIDLCGIMGGQNSAVTDKTKHILLFVQTYNPLYIRRTSMKLAQRTEAAQLFEKGTDPELVMPTLIKGVELIGKLAGGKAGSKIYDLYPKPYKPIHLTVNLNFINERLGVKLNAKSVNKILEKLGFCPQYSIFNTQYSIQVPSRRANDIKIPEDMVEEVTRVWGYHNLPSQLPSGKLPLASPFAKTFKVEEKIKTLLKGWGLTEVYTYSLVGKELLQKFSHNPESHLKLKNPLSFDLVYLRTALIPSLLEVLEKNKGLKQNLKLFEIANIYQPRSNDLPEEKNFLVIVFQGLPYYQLKGLVETLLAELNIGYEFKTMSESSWFVAEKTLAVFAGGERLGIFGQLKPELAGKMGLTDEIYAVDLELAKLAKFSGTRRYRPLPKYPAVIEDLTFVFPLNAYYAQVADLIKQISPLIVKLELVSQFQNRKTFRLYYQHPEKSLSAEEITKIRKTIVRNLAGKSIQLVGQV